jgi:beta-glucanase (GH16 family)
MLRLNRTVARVAIRSSMMCAMLGVLVMAATGTAHASDLDISSFHETFSETFRGHLDVTPWGPSKWIAHTPWHGDFGDATFADPTPGFPFLTGPDGLKITARQNAAGKWESGLLSSVDEKDVGFLQAGGYFEVRMKMPPGPGTWPAFWLVSHTDPQNDVEIDVIEYYGQFPAWYQTNLILWPKSKKPGPPGKQVAIRVPTGSLVDKFHTYGVEIRYDQIIYYLDRHEVRHVPTPPAARTPMSILINLALGSGWPIDKTPNPSVLDVDYVKAFRRN